MIAYILFLGMEKPKFEFYERPNGHNEFLKFLEKFPQKYRRHIEKEILHALAIYKKFEEKNRVPAVKFDDYLEKRLQDPELKIQF